MPTVAIIGRPNVGKSTLFNRLINQRKAIESSVAGTTRDKIIGSVECDRLSFDLIDTAGIVTSRDEKLEDDIFEQTTEAIISANLIYFCVNSRDELTGEEYKIAEILRTKNKKNIPVFIVITKSEKKDSEVISGDIYQLGVGNEFFSVSAKQNLGIKKLINETEKTLLSMGFSRNIKEDVKLKIAILGKPNAGKSTLINTLINKDLCLVSQESGTTRDSIDTIVNFEKESFLIIDTAGLRKKSSMNENEIERYSRARSIVSIGNSDIVVFLIDSSLGISHQDQIIAGEIIKNQKGVIVVFSKWDITRKKIRETVIEKFKEKKEKGIIFDQEDIEKEISKESINKRQKLIQEAQNKIKFLSWAPILFLSSVEKKGFGDIFKNSVKIFEERNKRVKTSILNTFLEQALSLHPPASKTNKQLKIKYCEQVGVSPPKFIFHVNNPEFAHFSLSRFLENRLREAFGFWGTSIEIILKKK